MSNDSWARSEMEMMRFSGSDNWVFIIQTVLIPNKIPTLP